MARQSKMVWEDLVTMEDVEDLVYMKGSKLDILAAVVGRATQKHEAAAPPPPSAAHGGGEASSSKKRNFQEVSSSSYSPASKKRKSTKCNPRSIKGKEKLSSPPPPPPPPPLPRDFERVIQDRARGRSVTALKLVIQKKLYKTDVAKNNNRLSVPISQIRDDFLTAEERRRVARKLFEVEMVAPSLEWEEGVKLSRWDMPKSNGRKTSSSYVINGKWKKIVKKNDLREGDEVQLWCFRVDQDLGFALVLVKRNSHSTNYNRVAHQAAQGLDFISIDYTPAH